jgi:hypothetical protein
MATHTTESGVHSRDPLLRLLAVNLAGGSLAALIAVGGLLAFDIFGLRRLMLVDAHPFLVLALLVSGFVVTFGSVAMGSAVMMGSGATRDRQ